MQELPEEPFDIGNDSPRWWVKVVDFPQHNWALPVGSPGEVWLLFVSDTGGIFDRLEFESDAEAVEALRLNRIEEFAKTPLFQELLQPPAFPLTTRDHPNGPIFSSGRFWRS